MDKNRPLPSVRERLEELRSIGVRRQDDEIRRTDHVLECPRIRCARPLAKERVAPVNGGDEANGQKMATDCKVQKVIVWIVKVDDVDAPGTEKPEELSQTRDKHEWESNRPDYCADAVTIRHREPQLDAGESDLRDGV